MSQHTRGGQRSTLWSCFPLPPYFVWLPGIRLASKNLYSLSWLSNPFVFCTEASQELNSAELKIPVRTPSDGSLNKSACCPACRPKFSSSEPTQKPDVVMCVSVFPALLLKRGSRDRVIPRASPPTSLEFEFANQEALPQIR